MNSQKLLIGSLSNDLYRVAELTQRGSLKAANKFLDQAGRWVKELQKEDLKQYIAKIIIDLASKMKVSKLNSQTAEKYLMYSVLLQNYTLRL